MTEEKWKIENDLCRCCLTEGSHKHLDMLNYNPLSGVGEIYAHMLFENMGLKLEPVEGVLRAVTYTICEPCIEQLRGVEHFRKQVKLSEEKFWDLYNKNVFRTASMVEVKVEEVEIPDADYTNDNDGLNIDEFSEEDTKLNLLEIKAESLKGKGKTKAKAPAKNKPAKKPSRKKVTAKKSTVKAFDANEQPIKEEEDDAEAADAEPRVKKVKGARAAKFRLAETDYATEGSEYVCKRCEKRYDKLCSLKFHIKTKHYKVPRYTCPFCQKEFMTPAPLTVHKLQEHNVDERHHCNACRGAFNTKVQLRKHINNFHMLGERYKCEFCEYESFSFEGMYKHKFKHRTVKDYHCRFCRKAFLRKTTLDLHERIHTGDRRKICTVCGQAFVQKASLNYHMAKYHPEVNF